MACSGLKTSHSYFRNSNKEYNSTRKILNLAFEIETYVKTVTWGSKGTRISLKIGIHFGNVIAGVIGYHKPQFSLIGDTINTTSRVCSTGMENSITLSEEAYNQVKNEKDIKFILRCVEAKGKGTLNTYQSWKIGKSVENPLKKKIEKNKLNEQKHTERRNVKLKSVLVHERNTLFLRKDIVKKNLGEDFLGSRVEILHLGKNSDENSFNLTNKSKENLQSEKKISTSKQRSTLFDLIEDSRKISLKKIYERQKPFLYMEEISSSNKQTTSQKSISNFTKSIGTSNKEFFDPVSIHSRKFSNEEEEIHQKLKFNGNFFLEISENDADLKDEFINQMIFIENKSVKCACFIYMIINFIQFFDVIFFKFYEWEWDFYLNLVFRLIIFFIMLFLEILPYNFFIKWKNLIMCIKIIILGYLIYNYYNRAYLTIISLLEVVVFLRLTIKLCIFFQEACFIVILLLAFVIILIEAKFFTHFYFYSEFIFLLSVITLYLYNKRRKQFDAVIKFNEEKHSLLVKKKYDVLITNLLPIHVTKAQNLIDSFKEVTILFADITGFTKYSSAVSPMQVVDMLRGLFTEFDKLCKEHEVYKVYTIGDCYVVVGFLDANSRDFDNETLNVLMMAFSMLDVIKEVRNDLDFKDLDMRIGIHRVFFFLNKINFLKRDKLLEGSLELIS